MLLSSYMHKNKLKHMFKFVYDYIIVISTLTLPIILILVLIQTNKTKRVLVQFLYNYTTSQLIDQTILAQASTVHILTTESLTYKFNSTT